MAQTAALRRRIERADHVQERRLAAARWTEDDDELLRTDLERHIGQRDDLLVTHRADGGGRRGAYRRSMSATHPSRADVQTLPDGEPLIRLQGVGRRYTGASASPAH